MWKKTLPALFILSPFALATPATIPTVPPTESTTADVELQPLALKQQWLNEQQTLLLQRENFLQLENLINTAIKQKMVSEPLIKLASQLISEEYPLQEETQWLLLRAKLAMVTPENLATRVQEIQTFSKQYPNTAKRNKLAQLPISLYAEHQKREELLQYAGNTPAEGLKNQCLVFESKYQQFNTEHTESFKYEQKKLLQEFDLFWQNTHTTLPPECDSLTQEWLKQGFLNVEKIKNKAVIHFQHNQTLADIPSSDENVQQWLTELEFLRTNANSLQTFAENQALDPWNQAIITKAFTSFVKSQPEEINQDHWAIYQTWAEKFQLSADDIRQWKIAFLNRAFDNDNVAFQQWRDAQLAELKADNLLERRLRMAIWQKTDLKPWLALLSQEAQNKQEWQYWIAKTSPEKATRLTKLSQERGFYPMLAANALGKPYQFDFPKAPMLNENQLIAFRSQLARVAELRALQRFDRAKLAWQDLLQSVSFTEKLALTHYAQQQNWFDLSVEGTIIAKAWDYIDLRLPNAYSEWFDLNLKNKKISKSFAMAIARQESAWNFQAKSHANALGLMQMLPTTAKQTAKNNGLPFSGEQDLLQPFRNIMLGTTHLAELNEKYPNNRILIAAAYNAGSHRVERWLARANGKLAMDEFIASIPFFETRGYVQNVLAYDYYYQMLQGLQPLQMFTKAEQQRY